MSSDVRSLRKILKYETNQKILILLNREALSSDELADIINVTPGMMTHHLQVLNEFLVKTDDEKYALSEKGKQAYTILNNMPKSVDVSRKWKITWLASTVSVPVVFFFLWYISGKPLYTFIMPLCIGLLGSAYYYFTKVNPKIAGRLIYIAMGAVFIGLFLWLTLLKFNNGTFFAWYTPGSTGDHITLLLSVVICYVTGGVIGELVGKKLQYKFPPERTF
ncbi:MAG: hypothetical protein FWH37_09975 [Candidatus Bathyarchaeota archaeon]|nr:hypothetical protein [Candidatus Termiticorpusculum sp.]